jgi:hypothetical protein
MDYRTFTIETGFEDGEFFYKIRGYGSKRKPENNRQCRRTMSGYISEQEALQEAKNLIDLKIKEGLWHEHIVNV